jgi:TatD DNase family protein
VSVRGLVDTHCHLQLIAQGEEGGATDEAEVDAAVADAAAAGVDAIVNIGLGADNAAVVATARARDGVFAAAGWHPHQARPPTDAEVIEIAELARDDKVVAIGEIGLDYHWRPGYHEVPVEVQKQGFRRMLELARSVDLPVVVHNREAHADTMAMLRDFMDVPAVMHAFSGDTSFAAECAEMGVTVSVAGPVTYPNAAVLRDALTVVPLRQLVVETDAPFLPPQPWRGKPCRPAMVTETARALAEIKGVLPDEIVSQTRANVERIFHIPSASG